MLFCCCLFAFHCRYGYMHSHRDENPFRNDSLTPAISWTLLLGSFYRKEESCSFEVVGFSWRARELWRQGKDEFRDGSESRMGGKKWKELLGARIKCLGLRRRHFLHRDAHTWPTDERTSRRYRSARHRRTIIACLVALRVPPFVWPNWGSLLRTATSIRPKYFLDIRFEFQYITLFIAHHKCEHVRENWNLQSSI